ncbi:hypothetical protein [Pelotalea chapellei]|nr:hypothetical protein [Pelotalea chapellei]
MVYLEINVPPDSSEIDRALEEAARRERERYDLTADEALAKLTE